MESDYSPQSALSDAAAAREAAAQRTQAPGWYYPTISLLTFLVCAGPGLAVKKSAPAMTALPTLIAIAALLISLAYRSIRGVTVGWQSYGPRARKILVVNLIVLAVSVLTAAFTAELEYGWIIGLICGAISATVALVAGHQIDQSIKQDIRDGVVPIPPATVPVHKDA